MTSTPARRQGFTLLEVIAVVLLTSILFAGAITYYSELSSRSNRAAETTRQWRHAIAVLDRVALDLERAFMLRKPSETDPIDHPWLFLAESRYAEGGADQLKFTARRRPDQASEGPRSEVAFVSYMVRGSEEWEDEYELLRWSEPGLPRLLDKDFPAPDDAQLVAEHIESFRVRFLGEAGGWHEYWDSSQLEHTGMLPRAAEIELLFAPPEGTDESVLPPLTRQVLFPLPSLDMETLADPEAYGTGSDEGEDGEAGPDDDTPACECIDQGAEDSQGRSVPDLLAAGGQNAERVLDDLCGHSWGSVKQIASQYVSNLNHPGILCE